MKNQIMTNITDEQYKTIVESSLSYSDICRKIGLRIQGSNINTIKRRIQKQNLSINHFNPYAKLIENPNRKEIPLESILVENSTYSTSDLKKRLLKLGLLKEQCSKCLLGNIWNNEPIVLQLDHINGNHKDNRIENLRILCPNCHTQTKTHSGKRLKQFKYCKSCNIEINKQSTRCRKCRIEFNKTNPIYVINWPDTNLLKEEVQKTPVSILCKKYGSTPNGLKKYCIKNNISIPTRGYWQKLRAKNN